MKKTLRATIGVAVAAILSLSCLTMTACGVGDNFGSQEYEAFDPDKQYQLDFLGWGSVAEQRNFQYMINQFMKENPNVKVFYNAISDTTTYSQNLINRANNLPDVFYVPDWDYIKWADSGRLVDFEKYLDEEEINQMWQKSIDIFRYDEATKTVGTGDKIYGLPKDLGPLALVYNKDLMVKLIDDYDLDVELPSATEPMTFTEFTAYLENFKGLKVDKETVIRRAVGGIFQQRQLLHRRQRYHFGDRYRQLYRRYSVCCRSFHKRTRCRIFGSQLRLVVLQIRIQYVSVYLDGAVGYSYVLGRTFIRVRRYTRA